VSTQLTDELLVSLQLSIPLIIGLTHASSFGIRGL